MEPNLDSTNQPEILTPKELAIFLKRSVQWVQKQAMARLLPGQFKVGRFTRFLKADIEKQLLTGQVLLPKLPGKVWRGKRLK